MAQILVPSIFITRDFSHIQDFFLSKNKRYINDLPNTSNSLLINGKQNIYLESFDLSYNKGPQGYPVLNLCFIDSDGEFEKKFFVNPINLMKDLLLNCIKNQSPENAEAGALTLAADVNHRTYVSFGVGNSLDSWSDPLAFELIKSNVDISNKGIKRYKFSFQTSPSVFIRPKIKFNFDDPNYEKEFLFLKYANPIRTSIQSINFAAQQSVDDANKLNSVDFNYFTKSTELPNVGPSQVIYNLLKKYISAISSADPENVIVIIPELLKFVDFKNSFPNFFIGIPAFLDESASNNVENMNNIPPLEAFVASNDQTINFFKNTPYFSVEVSEGSQELAAKAILELQEIQKKYNQSLPDNSYNALNQLAVQAAIKNPPATQFSLNTKLTESSLIPGLPDWFSPINALSVAFKKFCKTTDDLIVMEENNLKILKFFKEKGLIKDDNKRCVIVGFDRLISQWLYRCQMPEFDASNEEFLNSTDYIMNIINNGFKPDSDLAIYSKEKKILLDKEYTFQFLNTISKRKIGSSFGEKPTLDELAITEQQQKISNLFSVNRSILELFEVPVFLNNLKNSNILDISFENSEIYINAIRTSVLDNYNQYYFSVISQNLDKINVGGVIIPDVAKHVSDFMNSVNASGIYSKESYRKLREDLRKVLAQQFFFLEKNKTDLSNLTDEKFFNTLTGAIPENLYQSTQVVVMDLPGGGYTETTKFDDETILKNIMKETKFSYAYTPEQVKAILKSAKPLIENFDKLIIQSKGNIDISKFLVALSIMNPKDDDNLALTWRSRLLTNAKTLEEGQQKILSFAELLFAYYNVDINEENGPYFTFTPKHVGLPQQNIMAEIFKHQTQNAVSLSIKTLPFFHLINPQIVMFKPAFLFSKKIKTIKNNSNNKQKTELDFFSGVWNIVGFKHFISTKDCYSEFRLVKNTLEAIVG